MSTALPADPFAAWLLQQAPVVIVLIVLTLALWRRDADRDKLINANTEHIGVLTGDISTLVGLTTRINAVIVVAATVSVGTVLAGILAGNLYARQAKRRS